MSNPILYALDFDGVICDSAVETAISGWKAARQIWPEMPELPSHAIIDQFREARSVIETGYESILAVRLLFLGHSVASIYADFANPAAQLIEQAQISNAHLKTLFGEVRDQWIANDLGDWVNNNPLYDGIADKLQHLDKNTLWYVVTTKQERFVKHILNANGIQLADEYIYGLDRNMSKTSVLKGLIDSHPQHQIHFIEDRLQTLLNVAKHPELASIKLLFAPWGYSNDADKAVAASQGFVSISVAEFLQN